MTTQRAKLKTRPRKHCFLGAPTYFELSNACHLINRSFGHFGCYLVGSVLQRPDYRDVDVRFIMEDSAFDVLFPCSSEQSADSHLNARWSLICTAISELLRKQTGLPVDFQIQKQSHANERFSGPRDPIGFYLVKK